MVLTAIKTARKLSHCLVKDIQWFHVYSGLNSTEVNVDFWFHVGPSTYLHPLHIT